MKKALLFLLAVAIIFGISETVLARLGNGQGNGQGNGTGNQNFVDENKNGIADGQEDFDGDGIINRDDDDYEKQYANMRDADEDGISNREDDDYVANSQDGSGQQGFGDNGSEEAPRGNNGEGLGMQNQENQQRNTNRINNRYNNSGLGEQVRNTEQIQTRNQVLINDDLQILQGRSGVAKFFFGANQGKIKSSEEKLDQYDDRIVELKELSEQTTNEDDKALLEEQINNMEEISDQLKQQLETSEEGFSLLGWMFKLFN